MKPNACQIMVVTASVALLLASIVAAPGKDHPQGQIRVACYSRSYASAGGGGHVSGALVNDPMIIMQPIPVIGEAVLGGLVTAEAVRRAGRIYFARTYEQMLRNDVTIFQEAPLQTAAYTNFEPNFLQWCKRYVTEGGKGLDMYGGDASFGAGVQWYYPSWEGTPVAEVLPVEIFPGGNRAMRAAGGRPAEAGTPKFVEFLEDVIGLSRLPWDTAPRPHFDEPLNAVLFRPGSRRIAEAVYGDERYPLIAYWDIGNGSSLAYTAVFASGGTARILKWKWYPDFITYLMYYSAGVPMPENIYLPHVIRERLQIYTSEKEFVYNYLDFISKLGGNTLKLEKSIGEVEGVRGESTSLYLEGRYEESRDVLELAVSGMGKILEDAKKLQKSVMIWIYLIEWFTVVGTFLASGIILNLLMVRRRLYKEVATTRTAQDRR